MTDEPTFKVYPNSDKLTNAYDELAEKIDDIVKKYYLSYFELFGVFEALRSDIIKLNIEEE